MSSTSRLFSRKEVATLDKDSSSAFYYVIEQQVYKIPTTWAATQHPAGEILLLNGRGTDITIPFLANHRPEKVDHLLARFRVGHVDEKMTQMESEFVELTKQVTTDPRWFKADWGYFGFLMGRILLMLLASLFLVTQTSGYWTQTILSAVLLGAFFQQAAFLGHDLGHNGITHDRWTDETIGFFFGNFLTGISVGWWKATHNVHHLVTNSAEYDPDIQHLPVFAVSEKLIGTTEMASGTSSEVKFRLYRDGEGLFSFYHMKTFYMDPTARFFLCYQHYLYYPIMAVARFNLYLQSWILIASKDSYRRWGGNRRKTEVMALAGFWIWFAALLTFLPSFSDRIQFLLISHAIAGLLHVQITISHFPMEVTEGNPLQNSSFVENQLLTSLDVECHPSLDWFHGGLQFQAVHHLMPRVPRHNARALREELIKPFCKKHGLTYQSAGFVECNKRVFETLKKTAGTVNMLSAALNAEG